MKFSFIAALGLVAPALSQLVQIIEPASNSTIVPGQSFDVTVLQPAYIQAFTDVGIAITLASCGSLPCPDKSEQLGDVLYAGGYDPTTPLSPIYNDWFYQNFTVTAPADFVAGPAALSVVHAYLSGAGPVPATEVVNITVNVQ